MFHRSVNKRNVPDYYEVIKEPMALSILKAKINKREYKKFTDFVRDCALVWIECLLCYGCKSRKILMITRLDLSQCANV